MPLSGEELICPKFQPNIFDSSRCHDCLRQKHLHTGKPPSQQENTGTELGTGAPPTKEENDSISFSCNILKNQL
uniref:Uncharacterized protein n=1 Tax=Denticeps clupeoides TaxID=299321 RepID=A0AAY4D411_9TELE